MRLCEVELRPTRGRFERRFDTLRYTIVIGAATGPGPELKTYCPLGVLRPIHLLFT